MFLLWGTCRKSWDWSNSWLKQKKPLLFKRQTDRQISLIHVDYTMCCFFSLKLYPKIHVLCRYFKNKCVGHSSLFKLNHSHRAWAGLPRNSISLHPVQSVSAHLALLPVKAAWNINACFLSVSVRPLMLWEHEMNMLLRLSVEERETRLRGWNWLFDKNTPDKDKKEPDKDRERKAMR